MDAGALAAVSPVYEAAAVSCVHVEAGAARARIVGLEADAVQVLRSALQHVERALRRARAYARNI